MVNNHKPTIAIDNPQAYIYTTWHHRSAATEQQKNHLTKGGAGFKIINLLGFLAFHNTYWD
jgi:hypothetical protein